MLGMVDRLMDKLPLQSGIAGVFIGCYQRNIFAHRLPNKIAERVAIGVFDDLANHIALTRYCANDADFPQLGPPIWLPMAILILATNVRFIDFHFAHQLRKSAVLHRRSNAMAHIPGRAVVAAPDLAMNLQRADTLLALGHEIDDLEPGTDWVVGILKDGFCNDRKPIAVPSATVFRFADPVKRLGLQFVDLHVLTARALHAIRPTLLLEKLLARFFGREAFHQLRQRHAGFRHHVQPSLCWRGFFMNDLWVSS